MKAKTTSPSKFMMSIAVRTGLTLLISIFLFNTVLMAQTTATGDQRQERQRRATPAKTPEIGSPEWIKQQEDEAIKRIDQQEAEANRLLQAQERKSRQQRRTAQPEPTIYPPIQTEQQFTAPTPQSATTTNSNANQVTEASGEWWHIGLFIPLLALIVFQISNKTENEVTRGVRRLLIGGAGVSLCALGMIYLKGPSPSLIWRVGEILSMVVIIPAAIMLLWGLISTTIALCNLPKSENSRRMFVLLTSSILFLIGVTAAVATGTEGVREQLGRSRDVVGFLGGVGIVTSIVMVITGLRSIRPPSRDDSASYHGSARFATDREESEFTFPISIERGEVPSPGCFILGPARKKDHLVVLPLDLTRLHGLILGSTGTGKSRGFFMPNCAAAEDTSIVVTDPKSELWKFTSGFHQRPVRYAPAEPDASMCFNWVPLCSDARMAELCARAIIESGNTTNTDQFWIDAETAYLSAIFAHASTLEIPTPLTAYRLFTRQKPEHLLKQLQNSPSETAREQATIFAQTDARIKGAIVPAIAAKLQWMRDPAVARFTSASLQSPNFGEIRRRPTAVYWCLREQDITRLRPLTSLFFTVLLEHVAGEQIPEGTKGVPITMMLDEFANIGTIPDFATTLTLARGRGVSIWLGVQALAQLEARYGRPNAQVIIGNLSNKVALHGLDVTTAEYVSRMLGDTTIVAKRHNLALSTGGIGVVRQQTEHRRPLMTPDEVMLIGETEAIVRSGNRRPMILPKLWYDQEPRTASTTSLGQAQSISFDMETDEQKSLPEIPQLPGPINSTNTNKVEATATSEEEADFDPASEDTNPAGVILVDDMMLTDPYTK